MESQGAAGTPAQNVGRTAPRRRVILVAAVALVVVAAVVWLTGLGSYVYQGATYARATPTFSGTSESLKDTVIVPTLDSPCPANKNVIWCSSFQLAWNEVRDHVIRAPLEVPEAAELAARLNAAEQSVSDVDPGSVYATGGYIRDGIIAQIEKDMAARFPSHDLTDFSNYGFEPNGILAYSFIRANVPFKYPFRQVDQGFAFTNSQGIQMQVAGFGLWKAYLRRYESIRKQVEILYVRWADRNQSGGLKEYALDLCRHSEPYQVVIAMVEPRDSLAETLEHLRTQMMDFKGLPGYELQRRFGPNDELRVPEMFWRIDHRFKELIGKGVSNVGMPIVEALQTIEFRLDRSGAVLESEATFGIASSPRHFEFNRPFLVYMQKRGAAHPFFVMWVDNAELLTRQ